MSILSMCQQVQNSQTEPLHKNCQSLPLLDPFIDKSGRLAQHLWSQVCWPELAPPKALAIESTWQERDSYRVLCLSLTARNSDTAGERYITEKKTSRKD